METTGIGSFRNIEKNSFTSPAVQHKAKASSLSSAERTMISKEFTPGNTSLEFYEGKGSVRTENPSSRGSNIDLTI